MLFNEVIGKIELLWDIDIMFLYGLVLILGWGVMIMLFKLVWFEMVICFKVGDSVYFGF